MSFFDVITTHNGGRRVIFLIYFDCFSIKKFFLKTANCHKPYQKFIYSSYKNNIRVMIRRAVLNANKISTYRNLIQNNLNKRGTLWKLTSEISGLLGVQPEFKWPKGSCSNYENILRNYLKEQEDLLESEAASVAIAPSVLNTDVAPEIKEIDFAVPPSPEFNPFEICIPDGIVEEPIVPFQLIAEEKLERIKAEENSFLGTDTTTESILQRLKELEEKTELNDNPWHRELSPFTPLSPPVHRHGRNFNYPSREEKQSIHRTILKPEDDDNSRVAWEAWAKHLGYCVEYGQTPTSPSHLYPPGTATCHYLPNPIEQKGSEWPDQENWFNTHGKENYREMKQLKKRQKYYSKRNEERKGKITLKFNRWLPKQQMKAEAEPVLEKRNKEDEDEERFKQVAIIQKNLKPNIKLRGGMKSAIPPHLRKFKPHIPSAPVIQDSTHNYFKRNFSYMRGKQGAGMLQHFYNINPNTYLTATPVTMNFIKRLAHYGCMDCLEKTHGRVGAGMYPKLQFVFRHRKTNNYVRSKAIDTKRTATVGGDFLDDLLSISGQGLFSGSDDLMEDELELMSLSYLVPLLFDEGGCDSRVHTHNFSEYKVRTLKSNKNNCGIACLCYMVKGGKKLIHNTIRKECNLPMGTLLNYDELEVVADHLKVGFRIWIVEQTILTVQHTFGLDRKRVADIIHNKVTKHYSLLILVNDKKQCTLCGKFIRKMDKHICDSRTINFYRHFHKKGMKSAAEYKTIDDVRRDLEEVYIFDLETFPNEKGIHQPYACKMQNIGTKQEWLRYGRHGNLLQDIIDESLKGTPIIYEDMNPGENTGKFKYKISPLDKKWLYMDYEELPTQEEVCREANLRLRELTSNEIGRINGYHIDNDEKTQTLMLLDGREHLVMKWHYSYEYENDKQRVENILKEMKNYKNCIFVAHNLSRFDGAFLLQYLLHKNIEVKFVINSGRILGLKWNHSSVWDSCLFIPDSLKNIAKFFKCRVQKGDFDHTLIKSWEDVEKYRTGQNGWELYLDADVYSLAEIVEKYCTNVYDTFKVDVFKSVTLSSMTYKLWGQTTLKQHVVIETPQYDKYDFVKDSIYGGRVFPLQKHFATNALTKEEESYLEKIYQQLDAGIPLDDIKYEPEEISTMYTKIWDSGSFLMNMDMNSLYPTAMRLDMPVGISEWSSNPQIDFQNGYMGIYHIEFEPPKNLILAVLPQRNLPYSAPWENKEENKKWKQSGIKWSLEANEGIFTSVEIEQAIKYGYKIKFKQKALIWRQKAPVFKDYIEQIYKIKKEQDALEGTEDYNEIVRMIAKNMMNALYGKTCQRPIQDEQRIIKTESDFYQFCEDYLLTDYVWVKQGGENVLAVSGSPLEIENAKPSHLGAFILSYSRMLMLKDFDYVTNGLMDAFFTYTDTDSMHIYGKKYKEMCIEKPERFGDEIGQLSNDIKGDSAMIIYEYCLAPKCYMYIYITKDGKIGMKKKVKGVPKSVMKKLSMEDFENETEKKLDFESLKRNMFNQDKPFSISVVNSHRTFLKNKWSKMIYYEESKQFRPFGYNPEYKEEKEGKLEQETFDLSQYSSHVIDEYGLEGISWYFKQEPSLHLNKARLVKWVDQTVYQKKPVHHFTRLDTNEIIELLEKKKLHGSKLYEVTEGMCRLYCDVDLKRTAKDDFPEDIILREIVDCIIEAASKYNVTIYPNELFITNACSDHKYSFHINSTKHIFPTANHQKHFWETVAEISRKYPHIHYQDESPFDLAVYHNHRAMRTIYSCKPKIGNILNPVNYKNEEQFDANIEDYLICCVPSELRKIEYSKLSREPQVGKIKKCSNARVIKNTGTLSSELLALLDKNKNSLKGFDLQNGEDNGNMVRLNRIGPGSCCVCNRIHHKDNGFVYYKTKKPYFVCFRNSSKNIFYLI